MKTKQALYIGERNGIHDRRIIETLKQISVVSTYFVREAGVNSEFSFDGYDFIVAAPLTESISKIPNNITSPVIGVSLAYDVNLSSNAETLTRNIQKCSLIICDCEYIQRKICVEYDFPIERTVVIPFGCDLDVFKWYGIRDYRKPRFLITRNWSKLHSNNLILEALQKLHEAKIDFTSVFLGEGTELDHAKRIIVNSPLESRIEFRGLTSSVDVARLMQLSNIYISASSSDGSSVSLMEAMANGMVCLTSDFPSNLEWITDKKTGFLFRNGSSDNLAKVLLEILAKTAEELTSVGRMGQKVAENRADWNKNKEMFIDFILAKSNSTK